jgi:hypothetical protein
MNAISIFIDESGDLGFDLHKKRSRQYFVIGALVCYTGDSYKGIYRAVQRTIKTKLHKKSGKPILFNELKGSKTLINIKKYFLKECLLFSNWSLYFYVLDKKRIEKTFCSRTGKNFLYNQLANELIHQISFNNNSLINLYLDKHKSRKEEKIFNQYIETHLATRLSSRAKLNCYHLDSTSSKGIQAIDMFLWGIFEKYNFDKTEWYDLFKQRIQFERIFLEKKEWRPFTPSASRLVSNRWKGASQE